MNQSVVMVGCAEDELTIEDVLLSARYTVGPVDAKPYFEFVRIVGDLT